MKYHEDEDELVFCKYCKDEVPGYKLCINKDQIFSCDYHDMAEVWKDAMEQEKMEMNLDKVRARILLDSMVVYSRIRQETNTKIETHIIIPMLEDVIHLLR